MAKYLLRGSYTLEGAKGLQKEGGVARMKAAEAAAKSAGGKLDSLYFAFGADDVFAVVDFPDAAGAAAMSLAINTGGGFKGNLTPLITPEEMDAATKKSVSYRPPGR